MTNDPPRRSKPPAGPDWDAIARFLAGESAADEAEIVRKWLDEHPVDRELVERLDGIVVMEAPAELDVESALVRVHERMAQAPGAPKLKVQPGLRSQTRTNWPLYTGIALAAAAAIIAVVTFGHDGPTKVPTSGVAAARIYSTKIGERESIKLADGSRVILGPDSHLTVPAAYGTAMRAVELQGDGYFDIRHDAAKPFSVRVAGAIVEDVGTTFTVESDGSDATMVSVLTGSVRLRANNSAASSGALLAAGDRGSLSAKGRATAYPHMGAGDDAAWTTGRLVFHDAPLSRVAAEIHRWYGVTVRFADSTLLDRRYTNSFNGEPVDQVLKVIGLTLGLHVERQGDSAMVSVRRGPVTPR